MPRKNKNRLLLAFVDLAKAAEAFFENPAAGVAEFAKRAKAFSALKSAPRTFSRTAVELSWAVEETERFGLTGEKEWPAICASLRAGAEKLLEAIETRREAPLLDAKRHASEVERLCRLARSRAFSQPNAVSSLKIEGVCRRFSRAAEGLQRAADAAAASWLDESRAAP